MQAPPAHELRPMTNTAGYQAYIYGQRPSIGRITLGSYTTALPQWPEEEEEIAEEYDPASDPLAPFAGAFQFDVPDATKNLDQYLAEAYADRHDQKK